MELQNLQEQQQLDKKKRMECEQLIYNVMDQIDPTHSNSDYYKQVFASMSDTEFVNHFKKRFPIRIHVAPFKVEPSMPNIIKAFNKYIKVPLFEKVNMPYLFQDPEGNPIQSKECLVVYLHIKRMKQMLAKKTSNAITIDERDMRHGQLTRGSRGAEESNPEFQTLALTNSEYTIDELSRIRADEMISKEDLYATIASKGYVAKDEIEIPRGKALSSKMLYSYFLGANLITNVGVESPDPYITDYTLLDRQQKIERK